jgi:hypothetical protein
MLEKIVDALPIAFSNGEQHILGHPTEGVSHSSSPATSNNFCDTESVRTSFDSTNVILKSILLIGFRFLFFVSVNGEKADLKLPQNLIFQLDGMTRERPIITSILKHLFPIKELRKMNLTGNSKR